MNDCPKCSANMDWEGGTNASPEAARSIYTCPNPECGVTTAVLILEE